jgi:hypothetical protein
MPKLIVFSSADFGGTNATFQSNDPDLTLNGLDVDVASAFAASSQWTLYDAPGFTGNSIVLADTSGPDGDGVYRDYGDWQGGGVFHVRSIQHA